MFETDSSSVAAGGSSGLSGTSDNTFSVRGAVLLYVRLDRAGVTITWSRPSWSALRARVYDNEAQTMSSNSATNATSSQGSNSSTYAADYNLSANPEETLAPGLLGKLSSSDGLEVNPTGTILDEGFLDLLHVKDVALGVRDIEKEVEISMVARRFGIFWGSEPCCLSLMFGYSLNDNRILYMLLPPVLCR